jgi:drug/metabolite transporter (DMT)-like permease
VLLIDPLLSSAVICVTNAVVFLPLYVIFGDPGHLLAAPAADLWIQGIYQGVITAVVALIAFAFAVQRLGANAAASFTPLAPVLAAAFGWFVLGDTVDTATAVGLGMVALGVLIASREKPAQATTTSGTCEQTH